MQAERWRGVVEKAQRDPVMLSLLVKLLVEQDAARQTLRQKGYGWSGLGWCETVLLVPESEG